MKDNLFSRFAYDFWRRTLSRYGILHKGVNILECGTGQGNLLGLMAQWFKEVNLYGLDIDYQSICLTKEKTMKANPLVASAESLPFSDGKFDILISLHMIEHLVNPEKFLLEAARVLRPGGILALATPNPQGLGARLMGRRWCGWHPEHISLFPPGKWRSLLHNNRLATLRDGTTGISGIPMFRKLPLALLNWGPLFLFGFFPLNYGEADVSISKKASC